MITFKLQVCLLREIDIPYGRSWIQERIKQKILNTYIDAHYVKTFTVSTSLYIELNAEKHQYMNCDVIN